MKRLLQFCLFFSFLPAIGQDYGNEWIAFNQDYYQFKVSEDGIYRISYQDLVNANIPLVSIDPQNFQIYSRGKEVPIYIEGESDGVFNVNDYIEFYGRKNDGWIDSVFYKGNDRQPNPYYSLLNDSISYFITWNSSTNNRRLITESAIDFGNYISQFAWDGKDEYGDQLANGVYLYRVKVKLNGISLDNKASEADKFFTKEYGKMYLLR